MIDRSRIANSRDQYASRPTPTPRPQNFGLDRSRDQDCGLEDYKSTRLALARCGIVEATRLNVIWDRNLQHGSIWPVGYGYRTGKHHRLLVWSCIAKMVDPHCSGHISTWWPKNAPFLYALTLSNINRCPQLFHCQNQEKICNNAITKDPTTRNCAIYFGPPGMCNDCFALFYFVITACISHIIITLIQYF